jgi:hypothetical protein
MKKEELLARISIDPKFALENPASGDTLFGSP